ncbi:AfsR/SARP family transcriptional regulator [Kutzneria sp. CA-103260]|uniref:AfsR/SARP family transcriptional regulator n=1 Tax=Kutzneria sp. CA-103260 TaxID=2802641 RepID=UPI001BA88B85|nr:SARP family pathway specific regulatory protein [Kutzneria sp. CA-103260]
MLEFTLLGPVGVHGADRPVQLTSAKIKQVRALLLVDSPRVVDVGRIVTELWPVRPPKSALSTVHTYVYLMRKQLAEHVEDVNRLVATVSNGYVMTVDPQAVDAGRFERCVRDGRVLLDGGRAAEASVRFDEALAMWRGSALADVRGGPMLDAEAIRLEGLREAALELRVQAHWTRPWRCGAANPWSGCRVRSPTGSGCTWPNCTSAWSRNGPISTSPPGGFRPPWRCCVISRRHIRCVSACKGC